MPSSLQVNSLVYVCVQCASCKPLLHKTNQVFNNHSRYTTTRFDFALLPYQPTCRYLSEYITGYCWFRLGLLLFLSSYHDHPTLPEGVLVLLMRLLCNNICSVVLLFLLLMWLNNVRLQFNMWKVIRYSMFYNLTTSLLVAFSETTYLKHNNPNKLISYLKPGHIVIQVYESDSIINWHI